MEALYNHFSHPTKNKEFLNMQRLLGIKNIKIGCLSDTRWNCRFKNCEAVLYNYKAIVKILQEEIESQMDKNVNEAIGMLILT